MMPYDAIRKALTPDLLQPQYRERNKISPFFGHCYVAAEALFHSIGGMKSEWRPHRARDENGIVHWWLENDKGEILDPTVEQYLSEGRVPPYNKGQRTGFLTKQPSRRAKIVLERIGYSPGWSPMGVSEEG